MNSQSLCLACGLCCDGTLFGHVNLRVEGDVTHLARLRIGVVSNGTTPALKQPCVAYTDRACSIYSERPHACRQYQCRLLRRFMANKISEGNALDIIGQAIALRENVKQEMRRVFNEDDCNFDNFTARLRSRWNDAHSSEAKECLTALFQSFAALWFCINKHFSRQWER